MRWYENNNELSELLNFVESLNEDDKIVISQHLLQIIVNECNINIDKELSKFSCNEYSYQRWYDDVLDLSTSLEILKNLPDAQKDYVVKRFLSEIVMSYAKEEL